MGSIKPGTVRYVILLDNHHLGDRLFVRQFARSLTDLRAPVILVHGAAEEAERALEADGKIVEREHGVIKVGDEEERALVESATLDLNRRLVDEMTDEGLPTVRVDGASRGLLQSLPDGSVGAGRCDWLWKLAEQRVAPVVAALVPGPSGVKEEVNAGAVAAALALEADDAAATFLLSGSTEPEKVLLADLRTGQPHLYEELAAARARGATVLLSRPRDLSEGGIGGHALLD